MTAVTELLPRVLPLLPDTAEPVVARTLVAAAIEWCERTRGWQVPLEVSTGGQVREPLPLPPETRLFEIRAARFDGMPLPALPPQTLLEGPAEPGPPRGFVLADTDAVALLPPAVGRFEALAVLTPTRAATSLPADLVEDQAEALVDGALARLLLATAPADPGRAQAHRVAFEAALGRAGTVGLAARAGHRPRVRGAYV